MHNLSKSQLGLSWVLQLAAAGILLQTLFFKFTAAEESVYIFTDPRGGAVGPDRIRHRGVDRLGPAAGAGDRLTWRDRGAGQ